MQVNKLFNLSAIFFVLLLTSSTLALSVSILSPQNNAQLGVNPIDVLLEYDEPIENLTCAYDLNNAPNSFNCANLSIIAAQGENTLTIFANNTLGDQTNTTIQFNLDSNPPIISRTVAIGLDYITLNINTSKNATLLVNYTDNNELNSSINSALSTQHVINLTGLNSNTTYYYTITACDSFNNCANLQESQTTTTPVVQATPIQIELITPTGSYSGNLTLSASTTSLNIENVTFTLTNQTGNTQLNATLIANTSFWNTQLDTLTLTDGAYNLTATATNNQNNQNQTSTIQITIDNTKPTLTIYKPLNNSKINTTTINLNYSANDLSNINCWYTLDSNTTNTLTNCANTTLNSLTQTTHVLTIYANDSHGKTNSVQVNFTIDATTPTISNLNYDKVNATINLTWTTNEQTNYTIRYGYNGSYASTKTSSTLATTFNVQFLNLEYDETYGYNVFACDAAGNCANQTITVTMPHDPILKTKTVAAATAATSAGGAAAGATPNTPITRPTLPTTTNTNPTNPNQTTNTPAENSQTSQTIALQSNTNSTNELTAGASAFATAQDKNNFATALALLAGLSILMYGYKKPLLQRVTNKQGKLKKHKHAKHVTVIHKPIQETTTTNEPTDRFAYLAQVNKNHKPLHTYKKHAKQQTHVQKIKFKNGTLADHLIHAIKKRI